MPSCLAPLTLLRERKPDTSGLLGSPTVTVSCGKCPTCLSRRQSGWIFRLSEEQKISESSYFLTLTYHDSMLPYSDNGYPTLLKKDHQDFMKRLRKMLKDKGIEHSPLKYYCVGEYGTQTHRPHFHSILYNLPSAMADNSIINSVWKNGNVMVAECNMATIAYVSKYLNKRIVTEQPDPDDDRIPECSMMSKGLGKSYLTDKVLRYYRENMKPYLVIEDGQKVAMPRYFREKIYSEEQRKVLAAETAKFVEENYYFDNITHEIEWKKDQYRKVKKMLQKNRIII